MANNDTILQYCAAITAILAIGYILIVTNPPSSLTKYDNVENRFVHEDLSSLTALQEHGWNVLFFWSIFGILSFFIGMMTAFIYEDTEKSDFHLASLIVVIFMGILLAPYYGSLLAEMLLAIGILTYYGAIIYFSPKFRKKFKPFIPILGLFLVLDVFLASFFVLLSTGILSLEILFTIFFDVMMFYPLIVYVVLISYLLKLIKSRKIKKNNRA
jgi:hypothetical protein